jgi:zinc D-Ala-D-Ala dipeptidase
MPANFAETAMKYNVSSLMLLVFMVLSACAHQAVSSTVNFPLVDVQQLAPNIHLDMRYATANNFTGKKVAGYQAAKCLLHQPVAEALARVELGLNDSGYALVIYDCYRPTIAVDDFMHWAKDISDTRTKAEYYPDLDKSVLVPDYIAVKSGHSKGATLDLGLLDCRAEKCAALDMGSAFDFFGAQANTAYPYLTEEHRKNRLHLLDAMKQQGFENYPMEWWHFTWKAGVLPDQAYSVPIH